MEGDFWVEGRRSFLIHFSAFPKTASRLFSPSSAPLREKLVARRRRGRGEGKISAYLRRRIWVDLRRSAYGLGSRDRHHSYRQQMSYRIFHHHGPELGLETQVAKGVLDIEENDISIKSGGNSYHIPFHDIDDVQLVRLHKIGRVIRLKHSGGTHFVSVIRFMIGQFALINFFATGRVFDQIQSAVNGNNNPA